MRRTGRSMFIFAVVFVLTAAWALPAYTASTPKVLRWAYTMPSKKALSAGWEWLGPEFEKRTNGRYRIEYYPSETLFKSPASFDSALSGVCDFTMISVGQFEKRLPLVSVTMLPILDFPGTLKGRITASNTLMDMVQKFPQMQEELKGLHLFGHHQLNPYVLGSGKKEIYLPEHFKGLKVGGSGAKMKIITNYGGAAVTQIPPDAYMNMDRGLVDASLISWTQVYDYKLWEVAKYFYDISFASGAMIMVANGATWNAFSPEDQKIFAELWTKAHSMAATQSYNEGQKAPKMVLEKGGKIRNPTTAEFAVWKKAVAPVTEDWLKKAKSYKAKDPEAILAEWEKRIDAFVE